MCKAPGLRLFLFSFSPDLVGDHISVSVKCCCILAVTVKVNVIAELSWAVLKCLALIFCQQ